MKYMLPFIVLLAIIFALYEMMENTSGRENSDKSVYREIASVETDVHPPQDILGPREAGVETFESAVDTNPLDVAKVYLQEHRQDLGIQPFHELRPALFKSPLGTQVKFQAYQDGLPILGIEIELDLGDGMNVRSVDNRYIPLLQADTSEASYLTSGEIIHSWKGKVFSLTSASEEKVSKVLVQVPGKEAPEVAFLMPGKDIRNRPAQLLIRASDGQLLRTGFSRLER